ncbi:quinone-dependent dihydroorotate dehydrogenase [Acaryochloris marina]|uniref:quinone-dependent dihydroorotate dehydrogenase n=1 Tax=Acaryochloris marina TaxID=155978 RepID=UPI0021C467D8|nr:quinone-dependent dihydroorotate dehydrogenase [Acaryochloris marina]
MDLYQQGLQPLLFSALNADPETVHRQLMRTCAWLDRNVDQGLTQGLQRRLASSLQVEDPRLSQSLWGLSFANPIGLAAGFDKDGVATNIWPRFGFGFAEVGTVTFHAQSGNPQPRLFRLPEDQAALNRMGFNNQGAAEMAKVIAASLDRQARSYPLGINLGKSKVTSLEQAVADYVGSFQLLKTYGDYFVVNVSSPNTPGLRSLQAVEQLAPILAGLQAENTEGKPLLVKIAPDLEWEDIAAIVDLAQAHQLAGIIATNTTIRRDLKTERIAVTGNAPIEEAGGISGAPVRSRSTDVIRFIHQQTQGQLPIIGVGGIFTAEDAWEKLCAGASLLQVYTGWVYEGPWMVRRILEGLLMKMKEEGIQQLSDIVRQK